MFSKNTSTTYKYFFMFVFFSLFLWQSFTIKPEASEIITDLGHLSNETSGQLVNSLLHDKLKKIYLGHLSKENNYDKLAYETVKLEIDMSDNSFKSSDFDIEVAKRDVLSGICEI